MKKRGISLIVLVITIIVIVILAVAVILSIANNNPIENARKAAFLNDMSTLKSELNLYIQKKYADSQGKYDASKLTADKDSLLENGENQEGKTIKDVLTSMNDKYLNKIRINSGNLEYFSDDDMKEYSWAKEVFEGVASEYEKSEINDKNTIKIENQNKIESLQIYGNSIQETRSGKNLAYINQLTYDNATVISDTNGIIRIKGDEGFNACAFSAGQINFALNPIESKDKTITVSFYLTRYSDSKWKESSGNVFQLLLGTDSQNSALAVSTYNNYTNYNTNERIKVVYTFTPSFDIGQMSIRLKNMEWEIEYNTIQIEEGNVATDYEA